ncbi:thymidine kinase, partial [Mycoplasmopsis pullorum]
NIINVINTLTSYGVRVIVSGLDMDYLKRPFPILASLLAIADEVDKLKAVCALCKGAAGFSYRKTANQELNFLGNKEYEARCRHCHDLGEQQKMQLG